MKDPHLYPEEGARELLRQARLEEPEPYKAEGHPDRVEAAIILVEQVFELIRVFGFNVVTRQNPRPDVAPWFFPVDYKRRGLSVEVLVDPDGRIRSYVCEDSRALSLDIKFKPDLLWDPSLGKWLGPAIGQRDLTREGAPPVRLSAAEELTRALLKFRAEVRAYEA